MTRLVLTLNAGSSSIKFAGFQLQGQALDGALTGEVSGLGGSATFTARGLDGRETHRDLGHGAALDHHAAIGEITAWLESTHVDHDVVAVGHRVVHGGPDCAAPLLIDDALVARLAALTPLAPLHQPHNLAGIDAARAAFPGRPQVACFDTAFHRSHPFVSDTFALPRAFYDAGIRRYGFHGLSYEFIVKRMREIAPGLADARLIVAHLGNGASVCAIRNGRSVASTMGLTALDGLPMGTRCGQLDPGVVLYLISERGMDVAAITDLLYRQSGLKGMSGLSHDMRELEASSDPAAADAIAYFVSRVRREIGGLAAAIGGVDAIVFTGGIGEHAWRVREAVLSGLDWMGVALDVAANRVGSQRITSPGSSVTVLVVPTNEERMIAEHTLDIAASVPGVAC